MKLYNTDFIIQETWFITDLHLSIKYWMKSAFTMFLKLSLFFTSPHLTVTGWGLFFYSLPLWYSYSEVYLTVFLRLFFFFQYTNVVPSLPFENSSHLTVTKEIDQTGDTRIQIYANCLAWTSWPCQADHCLFCVRTVSAFF